MKVIMLYTVHSSSDVQRWYKKWSDKFEVECNLHRTQVVHKGWATMFQSSTQQTTLDSVVRLNKLQASSKLMKRRFKFRNIHLSHACRGQLHVLNIFSIIII